MKPIFLIVFAFAFLGSCKEKKSSDETSSQQSAAGYQQNGQVVYCNPQFPQQTNCIPVGGGVGNYNGLYSQNAMQNGYSYNNGGAPYYGPNGVPYNLNQNGANQYRTGPNGTYQTGPNYNGQYTNNSGNYQNQPRAVR